MRRRRIFLSNLFERASGMIELNASRKLSTTVAGFGLSHDRSRTGNFTIALAFVVRERKEQERTKLRAFATLRAAIIVGKWIDVIVVVDLYVSRSW